MNEIIEKGTIYSVGWYGYDKTEASQIEHFLTAHAQYSNAVCIVFIPRGKRKKRYIVTGFEPNFVIVKGWGHPEPTSVVVSYQYEIAGIKIKGAEVEPQEPLSVENNFNRFLTHYCKDKEIEILADYRGFVSHQNRDYSIDPKYKDFKFPEAYNFSQAKHNL